MASVNFQTPDCSIAALCHGDKLRRNLDPLKPVYLTLPLDLLELFEERYQR